MRKRHLWIITIAVVLTSSAAISCKGDGNGCGPSTFIGVEGSCGGTFSDAVSIDSISPETANANQSTSFTINVSYRLTSKDSGLLSIGFNTSEVGSFDMISSQTYTVGKGSGNHTFTVTTTPVDWGTAGTFQAYVNLSDNPRSIPWVPLASTVESIPILEASAQASKKYSVLSSVCREQVCF